MILGYVVAAAGDAKSYILVSQLPPDVYSKFVEDRSSSHMTGLSFVVIGIIQLGGGKIAEGMLAFLVEFLVAIILISFRIVKGRLNLRT